MKYLKSISLHLVFICVLLPNGISQSSIERNKEFEIGIDFARINRDWIYYNSCLLYTSDAADDLLCVDLGGRRIIKKKKQKNTQKQHSKHNTKHNMS